MNRGQLRQQVISRLQEESDPVQWTKNEINEYLDEGCEEHNKISWQVKTKLIYTVGLYANIFPIPPDTLRIISGKYDTRNGARPLTVKTRDWLNREKGNGWELSTSQSPQFIFEPLVDTPPYQGIRDVVSLWPVPTVTAITPAQEDLSAELNGVGELVLQDGDITRGIPVGITTGDIQSIDGSQHGMIVGIYERTATDVIMELEAVKRPRRMTSDGDEPELREANHTGLVNYGLYKCFDRPGATRDPRLASHYKGLFDEDIKAGHSEPIAKSSRTVTPWE